MFTRCTRQSTVRLCLAHLPPPKEIPAIPAPPLPADNEREGKRWTSDTAQLISPKVVSGGWGSLQGDTLDTDEEAGFQHDVQPSHNPTALSPGVDGSASGGSRFRRVAAHGVTRSDCEQQAARPSRGIVGAAEGTQCPSARRHYHPEPRRHQRPHRDLVANVRNSQENQHRAQHTDRLATLWPEPSQGVNPLSDEALRSQLDDIDGAPNIATANIAREQEVTAEHVRKSHIELMRGRLRRAWYNTHLTAPAAPSIHTLQRRLSLHLLFSKTPVPVESMGQQQQQQQTAASLVETGARLLGQQFASYQNGPATASDAPPTVDLDGPQSRSVVTSVDALLCGFVDSRQQIEVRRGGIVFERELQGIGRSGEECLYRAATLQNHGVDKNNHGPGCSGQAATASAVRVGSVVASTIRHQLLFSGGTPSSSLSLGLQTKEPYRAVDPRVVASQMEHEWDRQDYCDGYHSRSGNVVPRKNRGARPGADDSVAAVNKAIDSLYVRALHQQNHPTSPTGDADVGGYTTLSPYFVFDKATFNPLSSERSVAAGPAYDRVYLDRNPLGLYTADNKLTLFAERARAATKNTLLDAGGVRVAPAPLPDVAHRLGAWAYDDQLEECAVMEPYTLTLGRPYVPLEVMSRTGSGLGVAHHTPQLHPTESSLVAAIDDGPMGMWVCGPRSPAWEYFHSTPQEDRVFLAAHVLDIDDAHLSDPLTDFAEDGAAADRRASSRAYALCYLDHYQILTEQCAQVDWLQLVAGLPTPDADIVAADSRGNHLRPNMARMPFQMSGAGKVGPSAILQRFVAFLYRADRTANDLARKALLDGGGSVSAYNSAASELHLSIWFPLFHFLLPVPASLPFLCTLLLSPAPFHPLLPMGTFGVRPQSVGGTPAPGGSPHSPTSGLLGEFLGLSLSSSFGSALEVLSLVVSQCMRRAPTTRSNALVSSLRGTPSANCRGKAAVANAIQGDFYTRQRSRDVSVRYGTTEMSAFLAVSTPSVVKHFVHGSSSLLKGYCIVVPVGGTGRVGYVVPIEGAQRPGTQPVSPLDLLVFSDAASARLLVAELERVLDALLVGASEEVHGQCSSTVGMATVSAWSDVLQGVYVYGDHPLTFARRALPFLSDAEWGSLLSDHITAFGAAPGGIARSTGVPSVDWVSLGRRLLFSFEHGDGTGALLAEAYTTAAIRKLFA